MPYRISGLCVEVERADGWEVVTCHDTDAEARAHLAALNANVAEAGKAYEGIDFKPTEAMAKEAQRGLDWRAEFGRGGTAVGVARARDISNRTTLSPDTVKRMVSYFARHEVDKQGQGWSPGEDGYPSAGRIAWALWAGDVGRSWANAIVRRMEAQDEKDKSMDAQKAMLEKYAQSEVDYVDYAVRRNPVNAVCQTCRWFCGARLREDGEVKHDCHIVDAYPLDIVPTGWCKQWTERPAVEPMPDPVPVVEVEEVETEDAPVMEMEQRAEDDDLISLPKRVALSEGVASLREDGRAIGRYPAKKDAHKALEAIAANAKTFMFKALGGGKWFAAFTNNFEDRQAEIISALAHKRYVARVQSGAVPLPELWIKHKAGSRIGEALWVGRTDHFTYAIGKFDDTPAGRAMERSAKNAAPGEITLSHGFHYPDWAKKGGVYEDYNTFEISLLEAGDEANPYTAFTAIEENKMNEKDRALFKRWLGNEADDVIASVEVLERGEKEIAKGGAAYKAYAEDYSDRTEAEAVATKADGEGDDMDYKAMYGDLVKGMAQLMSEFAPMQKAMSKALGELSDLKAVIRDGLPTGGRGTTSTDLADPELDAMKKAVQQKQKPDPNAAGWNSFLPGLEKP